MNKTAISWTSMSWNPVTGCSKVSPGCLNCYAETLSLRHGWTKDKWSPANAKANVVLRPDRLAQVKKIKPGTRVFVNSMSDLFHELVPFEFIAEVFEAMCSRQDVTFQILTKRPERMVEEMHHFDPSALTNVWLGTSVEDQKRADERLLYLQEPFTSLQWTTFVSVEPLLEYVECDFTGIDWVICGGESGPGFRPMDHAWARRVRDDALKAGSAFFFKQSAAFRNEQGPALEHEDGTRWMWRQFPDDRKEPWKV